MKDEREKYVIKLTDDEICVLSKSQNTKIVHKKINKYAFNYLISLGQPHIKSTKIIQSLKSNKLETQSYLLTPKLTTSHRQLLISLRTRSYDVKSNYKKRYDPDMICRSCKLNDSYKDLKHLT